MSMREHELYELGEAAVEKLAREAKSRSVLLRTAAELMESAPLEDADAQLVREFVVMGLVDRVSCSMANAHLPVGHHTFSSIPRIYRGEAAE